MTEMLSPGVFTTEIDASQVVPKLSNSVGVFAGDFSQGKVDAYTIITSVDELISYYGLPNDSNYNDWYQAYNFLQYAGTLYISRACNTGGTATTLSGVIIETAVTKDTTNIVVVSNTEDFVVNDLVSFGGSETSGNYYQVITTDATTLTLDRNIEDDLEVDDVVSSFIVAKNGVFEAVNVLADEAVTEDYEYLAHYRTIKNFDDFENNFDSIALTSTDTKLKIMSQNPGEWCEDLEIAIATPDMFDLKDPSYAFDGIGLDDLFEYFPTGSQVGIVVKNGDDIVETFTVDFDKTAVDENSKSTYIEEVINRQSNYIFVKDNEANTADIKNYIFYEGSETTGNASLVGPIELVGASDSAIQADDLLTAVEVWENKEEIDIDIVIGNELDMGVSGINLVTERADCIAFIGAEYSQVVGKKSSTAVSNMLTARKSTSLTNFSQNNMFVVSCANYKYQYDRYNDKNRWVNIAGDIAGLRAQTTSSRASWWASAGLERGQIKNVKKLAFNPKQSHRDSLYKNGLNPIVTFPGQGTVCWGQKTLLDKASSFDRVNVRGLFNTLERALAKMAKYQVMEFNDNFTRNRIVSMIKPFLGSVQSGRGIQDYLVICDTTNNTADVISANQLVVDIYIKPTYVAEYIHLKFTNAGTNSFSDIIGA